MTGRDFYSECETVFSGAGLFGEFDELVRRQLGDHAYVFNRSAGDRFRQIMTIGQGDRVPYERRLWHSGAFACSDLSKIMVDTFTTQKDIDIDDLIAVEGMGVFLGESDEEGEYDAYPLSHELTLIGSLIRPFFGKYEYVDERILTEVMQDVEKSAATITKVGGQILLREVAVWDTSRQTVEDIFKTVAVPLEVPALRIFHAEKLTA